MSVWEGRAEAFRASESHRAGPSLDRVVEWCEPRPGIDALDVATGGGHVGRRLREAGCRVVSCDPATAMRADVVCSAEDLPFADESFDVVACRLAAHHFDDVQAALEEMARVTRRLVVIQDLVYKSERFEEAHRIRDPSHVRSYREEEWRELFEDAALAVEAVEIDERRTALEPWLDRVECRGEDAERVRDLLADWIDDDGVAMATITLKGLKAV